MPLPVTYEIMVDWDGDNWAVEPDFSEGIDDISDDVKFIRWLRGKDKEGGNSPAATLELVMKAGLCAKYSPFNAAGDLYGKIRPWLIVRVRAYHNSIYYNEYFGYIAKMRINPHEDTQSVNIYVTDGTDLLARQVLTQDYDDRASMSDGDAIDKLLAASGWSPSRRNLDTSGGADLFNYPATYEY